MIPMQAVAHPFNQIDISNQNNRSMVAAGAVPGSNIL